MANFIPPAFLENMSPEEIYADMISMLPQDIDLSEGNDAYNLLYPIAYEFSFYCEYILTELFKMVFPQFAEDYEDIMEAHASNRGLKRKPASTATGTLTITGTAGTEIPRDTAFSTTSVDGEPAIEFVTTAKAIIGENGTVDVDIKATQEGIIGNVAVNTIILKANNIDGISSCTNAEPTTGGAEQETIESLQSRIADVDLSQGQSNVGSPADYKRWALEVAGTGGAQIIPAQDDSGLVTIILTDANGEPASDELCTAVYNHIMSPDEPANRLTNINDNNLLVSPPTTVTVTVSATIETDGTSLELIKTNFVNLMKTYFIQAADEGKIRYTDVCSVINNTTGVRDFKDVTVNGGTANIIIQTMQIPQITADSVTFTEGIV